MTTYLKRTADFVRSLKNYISKIDRHNALALLWISLGHPRTIYDLRSGTYFRLQEAVLDFDDAVRNVFCKSACVSFNKSSLQWATLYPADGGFGLLSAAYAALLIFLSSNAAIAKLADMLCGSLTNFVRV